MTWTGFLLRIGAALVLGAAIGIERQSRQRMAGRRTNALVSVGSALFVALSDLVARDSSTTRIAAQVVSGIGFLGAGVIMREGLNVQGLNTAATLWCAAAVGTLAGSGFVAEAAVGAVTVIAAHILLRPLARKLDRQPVATADAETVYRLRIVCRSHDEQQIRALLLHALTREAWLLHSLVSEDIEHADKLEVRADIVAAGRNDRLVEEVVSRISLHHGVSAASWKIVSMDLDNE
jgi:putative Mg2+ transporter-C (MgtC) family protein